NTFYFRMGGFPALLLLLALPGSCMAGEDTQVFLHREGESFRANCSYDVHKNLHEKKFWCKELSEKYCLDLALSSPLKERLINHALHRSVGLIDLGHGWFSVIMTALRRENSGTYQCGVWGDLKNILLQRIQMMVSLEEPVRLFAKKKESLSLHCSYSVSKIRKLQHFIWCKMVSQIRCQPIIRGNPDQSIVKVGRTEMMNDFSWKMIRVWLKKLRLNDSGYHLESHFHRRNKLLNRIMLEVLACHLSTLNDRRNKASRTPDGELNVSTIYAVIRHQPQTKPEDVTYVNIELSPEVFFHAQEPPGNSVSSGSVEYATVIFRATTPHSGSEKRKTGPPKQSSTKPWVY
ncbi:LOW QUALITY PROTEIN: natural cytotoxicity triggering receptor 2, partial [Ciconia maguari]